MPISMGVNVNKAGTIFLGACKLGDEDEGTCARKARA